MNKEPLKIHLSPEHSEMLIGKPDIGLSEEAQRMIFHEMVHQMQADVLPGDLSVLMTSLQETPFFTTDLEEHILCLLHPEMVHLQDTEAVFPTGMDFEIGVRPLSEQDKLHLLRLVNCVGAVKTVREKVFESGKISIEQFNKKLKNLWKNNYVSHTEVFLNYEMRFRKLLSELYSSFPEVSECDLEYFDIHEVIGFERRRVSVVLEFDDRSLEQSEYSLKKNVIRLLLLVGVVGLLTVISKPPRSSNLVNNKTLSIRLGELENYVDVWIKKFELLVYELEQLKDRRDEEDYLKQASELYKKFQDHHDQLEVRFFEFAEIASILRARKLENGNSNSNQKNLSRYNSVVERSNLAKKQLRIECRILLPLKEWYNDKSQSKPSSPYYSRLLHLERDIDRYTFLTQASIDNTHVFLSSLDGLSLDEKSKKIRNHVDLLSKVLSNHTNDLRIFRHDLIGIQEYSVSEWDKKRAFQLLSKMDTADMVVKELQSLKNELKRMLEVNKPGK